MLVFICLFIIIIIIIIIIIFRNGVEGEMGCQTMPKGGILLGKGQMITLNEGLNTFLVHVVCTKIK